MMGVLEAAMNPAEDTSQVQFVAPPRESGRVSLLNWGLADVVLFPVRFVHYLW
jgi:hypothetical protein